jgi:hypothetical protein
LSSRAESHRITIADKVLFFFLIVFSIGGIFLLEMALPENQTVWIDVDGKSVYRLPADEDRIVSVEGPEGRTFIEIKDRKVRVTGSPCGNKFCIRQGWVGDGVIVCLPNRVVVTIGDHYGEHRIVDAITG